MLAGSLGPPPRQRSTVPMRVGRLMCTYLRQPLTVTRARVWPGTNSVYGVLLNLATRFVSYLSIYTDYYCRR